MLLDSCNTLDDFLHGYGSQLAAQARALLNPRHSPGTHQVLHGCHGSRLAGPTLDPQVADATKDVVLPHLMRKPFPAQSNVMAAIVKGLRAQKSIQLIAEMGTGKTLMSEGAAHAHCLAKNANHWNEMNGRAREIRTDRIADPTAVIRANHSEVNDIGPVKMMKEILPLRGTARTFTYAGRKFTVEAVEFKDGRHIGKSPVYDVVASCRTAGMKPSAKPVAFRTTCRGAYRVLIVCPTVLLDKWERELLETVPHAVVYRLKKYNDLIGLAEKYRKDRGRFEPHWAREQDGKGSRGKGVRVDDMARRNDLLPDGGKVTRGMVRTYPIGYEFYLIGRDSMKLSGSWKHSYGNRWLINDNGRGKMIGKARGDGLPCCTRCGALVRKKPHGDPEDESYFGDARRVCKAKVMGPERDPVKRDCGERMWQETVERRRYAPSRIIQQRLKGYFDVSIFDEAHEYKSDDSLQADAMGGIAASARKCMALTGTLVGGYAWHLRSLLYRLGIAHTLLAEGLKWEDFTEFTRRYGRIFSRETVYPDDGERTRGRTFGRNKKRPPYTKPAPGIVYSVFKHLIHNSIFLSLWEVAANLPRLDERVVKVPMDGELEVAYKAVERDIANHIKDRVQRGSKAALGMMVNTLLLYPDHPWGWEGGVGYWEKPRGATQRQWTTVSYPANLDPGELRNKERAAVEWAKAKNKEGHQVWLYCVFNGTKNTQGPLAQRLRAEGLRVAELNATVEPVKREAWINRNGPLNDVIVSHPALVQTGLDFFDKKPGGHNYSAIGFFQSGYSIFTLRQAARRAWRIGQKRPCETAYFYYEQTMQDRAMGLMGKKIQAAQQLEGNFSSEGLAAMAGDEGGIEAALAKSLIEASDESGGCRAWEKVTDGGTVTDRKPVDVDDALAEIARIMEEMGITEDQL